MNEMPLSTTYDIAGRKIVRTVGVVRGNTIRARHIGRDIRAVLKGLVGGEITDYTKMIAESRDQSIDRMIDHARSLGADAIVGVRFATTAIMQGAAEILVFGTAVVTKPADEPH